jgi:hypothetical protein
LFTEKDILFDPKLIGAWKEPGDDEMIVFEKVVNYKELPAAIQQLAPQGYIISLKNNKGVTERKYIGFICRLGNDRYLDFFPLPTERQQQYDAFYRQHLVSLHSFYRMRFTNERSFEIAQLKEEYLKDLINKKQVRIPHEVRDDGSFLVTASTKELQQYVLKYGNVPDAYESLTTYSKITQL